MEVLGAADDLLEALVESHRPQGKAMESPRCRAHKSEVLLRYRRRDITREDLAFLKEKLAACGGAARVAVSREICQAWGWRQANGELAAAGASDPCCPPT